jgi:hypothetical protein
MCRAAARSPNSSWKTTTDPASRRPLSHLSESLSALARLIIIDLKSGVLGPWNGPFDIEADDPDLAHIATAYVMKVVGGVSSYNKKAWEESSLLRSYAVECFEEIREDNPDAGALLEQIEVDLSRMPAPLRDHAMWKLHRAILACLPGVRFIE